jgi:hypothetical protein
MSTEPEPTQPTPAEPEQEPTAPTFAEAAPTDDQPPAEPPPIVIGPEPEEDHETPPPPDQPGELVVTVEPGTWYEVTSVCSTTTCPNLNTSTTESLVYSNAGRIRMVCGLCGKDRPILSYTKLDPQPEMS